MGSSFGYECEVPGPSQGGQQGPVRRRARRGAAFPRQPELEGVLAAGCLVIVSAKIAVKKNDVKYTRIAIANHWLHAVEPDSDQRRIIRNAMRKPNF